MFLQLFFLLFPLYLVLVAVLRYRRISRYRQLTPAALQGSPQLQWEISEIMAYDFPMMLELGTSFGLFRTYGIPSISKLLCATKEFELRCAKRYEDTGLLLCEVGEHPPGDERVTKAINRINEIHRHYKISNDDSLYTMTIFVCEPIRWIDRYEWRPLTDLEKRALCMSWQLIGKRMNIQNIPDTLEGFFAFNEDYERKHMKFSRNNKQIADMTIGLFLSRTPNFLKPVISPILFSFMDDRLREAMGFPTPPAFLPPLLEKLMRLRAWVVRNLCLPRWNKRRVLRDDLSADGLYLPRRYEYWDGYMKGYKIEQLGPDYAKGGVGKAAK